MVVCLLYDILHPVSVEGKKNQSRLIFFVNNKTVSVLWQEEGYTVSVLGRDKGYTVKYNPLPEGVPEGEARGNS